MISQASALTLLIKRRESVVAEDGVYSTEVAAALQVLGACA
jgi:hypothetical protein